MLLDLGKLHAWIAKEVARHRSIGESMARLLAQCEKGRPHPDWVHFQSLPYDDLSPLLKWIRKPFRKEPPIRPLRGLWFGLFNPCPDGRTPSSDLYVCGSERFDPDPTNNNLAVGPDWWPGSRYAESAVLADIYRIAYRQKFRKADRKSALEVDAEFPRSLGYAAFAVRELIATLSPRSFWANRPHLALQWVLTVATSSVWVKLLIRVYCRPSRATFRRKNRL
jgi:hypothetical protein